MDDEFPPDVLESIRQLTREFNAWVEPLEEHEREDLEVFCERVERIQKFRIFKELLCRCEVTANWKIRDGVLVHAEIENLDEENLEGFVSTARLFSQNNDRISVSNIAKIFDKRVSPRHKLWMTFNAYRSGLNAFLDEKDSELVVTHREIFSTFLYGHYVHTDRKKGLVFNEWRKNPERFVYVKTVFLITLASIFADICELCHAAKQLLVTNPTEG